MVEPERILQLNGLPETDGKYVLYWMQAAQRLVCNHALSYAVRRANALSLPLVIGFGLTDKYPEANARHYSFMLQGLFEIKLQAEAAGIRFVLRLGSPAEVALALSADATLLVTDRGYLRHEKQWRNQVALQAKCAVVQIETNVVVPVERVSDKEEFAARTLRPRITRLLPQFLRPFAKSGKPKISADALRIAGNEFADPVKLLQMLKVDRDVTPVEAFTGGYEAARKRLDTFIAEDLKGYATQRNEPAANRVSHLSPYLHFGMISPLEIALKIQAAGASDINLKPDVEAYLEELIVRRELSMNFIHFNPHYDQYEGALPIWAKKTLRQHAGDLRAFVYDRETLDAAKTHDPYWNAAQRELVRTGKMHNYMRMYWGKKILEWSAKPDEAFATALYLNNRYNLDGRDPNSFTGVAWCFGKHDRPWQERPIFGQVRYMNAAGLERKFDIKSYVSKFQ